MPARRSAHLWEKRHPTVLATYQITMPGGQGAHDDCEQGHTLTRKAELDSFTPKPQVGTLKMDLNLFVLLKALTLNKYVVVVVVLFVVCFAFHCCLFYQLVEGK